MEVENKSSVTVKLIDNEILLVPFPIDGTGTIETVGTTINGTGTAFNTELEVGTIIWDGDKEWRTVVSVKSDTLAVLDSAFSEDLAASSALFILAPKDNNAVEISAIAKTVEWDLVTTEIATIPPLIPINLSKAHRDRTFKSDLIPPCIIDATGSEVVVTLIRN